MFFSIRAINFNDVAEIKGRKNEDIPLSVILEGVVSPDLKNADLMKKYKAATPIDMLKELLLPGEIEDLSREIETLSGYRGSTVEEIKKIDEEYEYQLMYYLFREKNVLPGSYYNLPAGDKVVIRAFFEKHMDELAR